MIGTWSSNARTDAITPMSACWSQDAWSTSIRQTSGSHEAASLRISSMEGWLRITSYCGNRVLVTRLANASSAVTRTIVLWRSPVMASIRNA